MAKFILFATGCILGYFMCYLNHTVCLFGKCLAY